MIISGERLRLYFWDRGRANSGPNNLSEIEKKVYGYNLEPGQYIHALRYSGTNLECYFYATILEVSAEGLKINIHSVKGQKDVFVSWVKEFPCPANSPNIQKCTLYLEPCEYLFEKSPLSEILSGNIATETYSKSGKVAKDIGEGIWYKHGGWRSSSRFQDNLKNFIKLGQQTLF